MKFAKFFLAGAIALLLSVTWIFAQTINWQQTDGPYGGFIKALAINSSGHIFAGTDGGGICRSTDNGATWTTVNAGLTKTAVRERENAGEIPASFELSQNHPNPFNPSTTITYVLPHAVNVSLVIYDMLGRHVRTLVEQRQHAGRYEIIWDGRNEHGESVSSGLFIYQLRAGDFLQTRRMALVR